MNEHDACADLCSRHGLEIVRFRTGVAGGSRYIAHVRDGAGRSLMLKQTTPDRGPLEITALRAWRGNSAAAQLVEELGDGAYLTEWLDGTPVSELPPSGLVDFAAIGGMLRTLHRAAMPDNLPDVRRRCSRRLVGEWSELAPEMMAVAADIADRLRAYEPPQRVLLHGDVVPANVIVTASRPRVIDPLACTGLPAWDLAQFAVAAAGRGRRGVIKPLLDGYGSKPPLIAEMFAWLLLFFLRNNLAAGRAEFANNLQPLAVELVRLRDPVEFLRAQGVA